MDRLAHSTRAARLPRPNLAEDVRLVQPLSGRELRVLRLLAAGRSNQQIADELAVVLGTAKKHVSHILDTPGDPTVPRLSPPER